MRLFPFLFALATAQINEVQLQTQPLEPPCNPVIPICNSTWICPDNSLLTYLPNYGWLCENNNYLQLPETILCPFGGSLYLNDCIYTTNLVQGTCPSFATLVNSKCVFKHTPHCPSGYLYIAEKKSCVPYTHPICSNSTVTPSDSPIVIEKPSESPIVIEKPSESPIVIEKPSESVTPSITMRVIEKPSESPSMTMRVIEKPSESVTPSITMRVIEKPSESPSMTMRVIEKPSESVTPSITMRVIEKPSESPIVIEKPSESPIVIQKPSESPSMTMRVIEKPSESPIVNEKPSESPSPICGKWICPEKYIFGYISTTSHPVCIERISKDAIRSCETYDADGACLKWYEGLGCPDGYIETDYACENYIEPIFIPCGSESVTPSMTMRVIEKPSESPSASVFEIPSESPSASVFEIPSESPSAFVVEGPSESPSAFVVEGPSESPSAFVVEVPSESPSAFVVEVPSESPSAFVVEVPSESVTPSMTTRVIEKPLESVTPSMTTRVIEKPSESVTPSMTTRVIEKPSESVTPSMTMRVIEKPSESPIVIEKPSESPRCGKWICTDSTYSIEVNSDGISYCTSYQRPIMKEQCLEYDAAGNCLRLTQIEVCPDKYQLLNGMCIMRIDPVWEGCTPSPTPTPTPKTYIQGTLTIEINSNSTSNITAFEDPAIMNKLREAIGILMGVDPSRIIINNIQWIQQGTYIASFLVPSGRRLIDIQNGFIIDYSIIDGNGNKGYNDASMTNAAAVLSAALGTNVQLKPSISQNSVASVGNNNISAGGIIGIVVVGLVLGTGMIAAGHIINKRIKKKQIVQKLAIKQVYNPTSEVALKAMQNNYTPRRFSATRIDIPGSIVETAVQPAPSRFSIQKNTATPINVSKKVLSVASKDNKWESLPNVLFKHPKNKTEMTPVYANPSPDTAN